MLYLQQELRGLPWVVRAQTQGPAGQSHLRPGLREDRGDELWSCGGLAEQEDRTVQVSVVHSHWSRSVEALLLLVETQLKAPEMEGISCLSHCLYGIRYNRSFLCMGALSCVFME